MFIGPIYHILNNYKYQIVNLILQNKIWILLSFKVEVLISQLISTLKIIFKKHEYYSISFHKLQFILILYFLILLKQSIQNQLSLKY